MTKNEIANDAPSMIDDDAEMHMTKNEIMIESSKIIARCANESRISRDDEIIDDCECIIVEIDEIPRDSTLIALRALLEMIMLEYMID